MSGLDGSDADVLPSGMSYAEKEMSMRRGRWEEVTDEFDVVSEDGERFHLLVHTTMIDASHQGNLNAPPLRGRLPTVRTSDGLDCSPASDGNEDDWIIFRGAEVIRAKRIR
jgi:hypothetical protein